MGDELRFLIIVIGILFILGILLHGLWKLRKPQQEEDKPHAYDTHLLGNDSEPLRENNETLVSAIKPQRKGFRKQEKNKKDEATHLRKQQSLNFGEQPQQVEASTPTSEVAQTKTAAKETSILSLQSGTSAEKGASPTEASATQTNSTQEQQEPQEVHIYLYVTGNIEGQSLITILTELGFKHGKHSIFHRHVDTSGKGEVLFSLGNMYRPGHFDIDHIESFRSSGLVMYMSLPMEYDPSEAFTFMLKAANRLASHFPKGTVLGSDLKPFTSQTTKQTYDLIRDYLESTSSKAEAPQPSTESNE